MRIPRFIPVKIVVATAISAFCLLPFCLRPRGLDATRGTGADHENARPNRAAHADFIRAVHHHSLRLVLLTTNISVSSGGAIVIAANNVTLDLDGFHHCLNSRFRHD